MPLPFYVKDNRQSDPITIDWSAILGDDAFSRIRCPLCHWRPSASSMWSCHGQGTPEPPFDGCGTSWNTFDTRGRCPGCSHQWRWTTCLRCQQWSLHEDWYEDDE